MKIIVGTRGSQLALTQTHWVVKALECKNPNDEYIIKVIETKGDKVQNKPLSEIGGSGVFVKEIEQAIFDEKIDFAVHSLKDMPSEIPEGLVFADYPLREDPRDVLITKHCIETIEELPVNSRIGTGSKRRQFQILNIKPDCSFIPIRGNIDTRIRKYANELDGIVLAMAGINRLDLYNLEGYNYIPLTIEQMLPSPCQGLLGLQLKKNNEDLLNKLNQIGNSLATIQGKMERSFLKAASGNCHIPIGAYCELIDGTIHFEGLLGDQEGQVVIRKKMTEPYAEEMKLGELLGLQLLKEVGI